jgi:lipopolysaccharide export system ATP-binding protein
LIVVLNVLSLFRRRRSAERWVNAPARARRANGYLNFFSLLGWKRAPVRAPQSRGVQRHPEAYDVRSPPPDPRLHSDPADIDPYAYEERTVAAQALQPGRRYWDEAGGQYDDAEPAGISSDRASVRHDRWGEPADDIRDDADSVETPPTLARRPLWDVPEQDDGDIDAASDGDGEPEREPHWAGTQQEDRYLAVRGVEKSFAGRKVVKGVSLYLRRGEAVGLLGPNGAGKTTVFYMITGLVKPDRGRIELDGHDITGLPMYQHGRLGIGYLPQEASIFRGLSVEKNIRAVLERVEPDRRKREAELDALLDEFNITHLRKTRSIALSGGERRRVEIARALATRPAYMLLDEPFAGIDPIAVGDIQALVRHLTQRGIGVLITDHNVRETLGLTDRAYIIYSGEVLMEGNTADIVNDPEVRRLYLGEEFRL